MLKWSAAYPQAPGADLDPDAPPLPVVTAPDGRTVAWDDPALPGALRDDLGRPVDLVRDLALMPDLPDSLLVTVEASRPRSRASSAQRGRPAPLPHEPPPAARRRGVRGGALGGTAHPRRRRRARAAPPVRALRDPDPRPGHQREVAAAPALARARARHAVRHQRPRRRARDRARRRPGHGRLRRGQPRGRRPERLGCDGTRRRGTRADPDLAHAARARRGAARRRAGGRAAASRSPGAGARRAGGSRALACSSTTSIRTERCRRRPRRPGRAASPPGPTAARSSRTCGRRGPTRRSGASPGS